MAQCQQGDGEVSDAQSAEPVRRWELWRALINPKVRGDQARLDAILDEGWEPYAAAPAGQAGDVYYFRRLAHIDGDVCR